LVSYDIPNLQKVERDFLRQTLERWNFRKVQESLWVSPFDYSEEVAVLALNLGIPAHVILMTTNKLPDQERFEAWFGVRKP
jgi:DNA-binding transcriptional regulator PaaX